MTLAICTNQDNSKYFFIVKSPKIWTDNIVGVEHWLRSIGRKIGFSVKLRILQYQNSGVRLWGQSSMVERGTAQTAS